MTFRGCICLCLAVLFVTGVLISTAQAQGAYKRKPDFADEVDTVFSRAAKEHNRQKFFSIFLFVVLGGAATYAQMRGIRKIVSKD